MPQLRPKRLRQARFHKSYISAYNSGASLLAERPLRDGNIPSTQRLRPWPLGAAAARPLILRRREQGSDGRFDLSAEKPTTVLLRLPRFEARFNESVNTALADAGMPCAFQAECAKFTRHRAAAMKIDRVAHATFLRVDEKGTKAAAATAVTIVVTGARLVPPSVPRMIVDRPFLVTLRDRASGAVLFFGRISDPTAAARRGDSMLYSATVHTEAG